MSLLQRPPIDAEAISYTHPNIPLEQVTTMLMQGAFSLRPYAAGVVRHAVPPNELRDLNALSGQEQWEALQEVSFLRAVNRAMHSSWQAKPWSPNFTPTDLCLRRLISDTDTSPHIDQQVVDDGATIKGGPLVALLMLRSEVEYYFKTTRKNPFSARHAKFFAQTYKPWPSGANLLVPTAQAGDVVLFTPQTIHYSQDFTDDPDMALEPRLTAGYMSGFSPTHE